MVFKVKVKRNIEGEKPFLVAVSTAREDQKASLEALETFRSVYDQENYSMESFTKATYNSVDIQEGNGRKIYSLTYLMDNGENKVKKVSELVWTNLSEEDIIKKIPFDCTFKSLVKEDFEEIL